ncbi:MAG: hypothetical protein WCS65_15415 [Verrucomicrobiae bacterium]
MIHGILRVKLLNRRVGDRRARQIAVFTGSALIVLIAWLLTPWLGASHASQCFWIGGLWFVLMLAFELWLGRLFGFSWKRLASDFDFRKGGLLSIGMAVLWLAPWIGAKLHGHL